ncbi:MAG: carboxymuconolactone decarboxylase family protein [archaeon]|nr:carboxymuconolactone decarboxylase family protein [archaeon]
MSSGKLSEDEIVNKILAVIEKQYGFIPLVNQVLSERPDIFIPSVNFARAVLENDNQRLDNKTKYLCAVSAATASGGEYCLEVQTKHALSAGATREDIFEAILIGSFITMTKAQSYAFRKYKSIFDPKQ